MAAAVSAAGVNANQEESSGTTVARPVTVSGTTRDTGRYFDASAAVKVVNNPCRSADSPVPAVGSYSNDPAVLPKAFSCAPDSGVAASMGARAGPREGG